MRLLVTNSARERRIYPIELTELVLSPYEGENDGGKSASEFNDEERHSG